jgi:hypothetical protein
VTALLVSRTEWGVRHRAHLAAVDAIDVCRDEAQARRFQRGLRFCGPVGSVLVARAGGVDAAWIPMGGAT